MRYSINLRGIIDARVEQEINRVLADIYNHFENEIKSIESRTTPAAISAVRKELDLFAANLAAPLIDPTGNELASIQQQEALDVADIPNLPAAKITSGTLPLARLDAQVLKSDDGLAEDTTGAPNVNTGKVIIKDNSGNSINVMTCA